MADLPLRLALVVVPAILAITLHEAAHGFAALALGDDTARRAGRLSLNPLRHVDPFGTVILPGLLWLGHVGFILGWAKPVPVSAASFADPRRGMMLVAAAGPGMNFLLAWLGALGFWGIGRLPPGWVENAAMALDNFILTNLVLGLFNLLPVPPLDGGRIVVGLLPERLARGWASLERFGLVLVVLLVVVVPAVMARRGIGFDPVEAALSWVLPPVARLVFFLAGRHGGT